jgi:chromate transporter
LNLVALYLLLLKATLMSFSGLASLPVVHNDLVAHRGALSARQMNAAVAAGQATPGPLGLYIVGVGYFVAGWPGAAAGTLALMTPAFLVIPLMRYLGRRADRPRVKSAIEGVCLAAAGLVAYSTLLLARDAVSGRLPLAIAIGSFLALTLTRTETVWVIAAAALLALGASFV